MSEKAPTASEPVFRIVPGQRFFSEGCGLAAARDALLAGLERRDPISLLVGPDGLGKTTLVEALKSELARRGAVVIAPAIGEDSSSGFITAICEAIKEGHKDDSLPQRVQALTRYLVARSRAGQAVVLVLDDGDKLSSESLWALHTLVELQHEGRQLLLAVVAGSPALVTNMESAEIDTVRLGTMAYRLERSSEDDVPEDLLRKLETLARVEVGEPIQRDHGFIKMCRKGSRRRRPGGMEVLGEPTPKPEQGLVVANDPGAGNETTPPATPALGTAPFLFEVAEGIPALEPRPGRRVSARLAVGGVLVAILAAGAAGAHYVVPEDMRRAGVDRLARLVGLGEEGATPELALASPAQAQESGIEIKSPEAPVAAVPDQLAAAAPPMGYDAVLRDVPEPPPLAPAVVPRGDRGGRFEARFKDIGKVLPPESRRESPLLADADAPRSEPPLPPALPPERLALLASTTPALTTTAPAAEPRSASPPREPAPATAQNTPVPPAQPVLPPANRVLDPVQPPLPTPPRASMSGAPSAPPASDPVPTPAPPTSVVVTPLPPVTPAPAAPTPAASASPTPAPAAAPAQSPPPPAPSASPAPTGTPPATVAQPAPVATPSQSSAPAQTSGPVQPSAPAQPSAQPSAPAQTATPVAPAAPTASASGQPPSTQAPPAQISAPPQAAPAQPAAPPPAPVQATSPPAGTPPVPPVAASPAPTAPSTSATAAAPAPAASSGQSDTRSDAASGAANGKRVPSAAAIPAPGPAPAARPASPDDAMLMERGEKLLAIGDVTAARLFFELAAANGSARAATAVGKTYDPVYFKRAGIVGTPADPGKAAEWYRKAIAGGDQEARTRLDELGRPR